MGDYGGAVSQKGYDVENCADRFLVYSSAFQTLKVFGTYSVSTTRPASGINTITINHNLGYYAPYIVIYNGSTSRGVGESFLFSDGDVYSITTRMEINNLNIDIDDFFDYSETNNGDTVYFTVYIFLDDFRTISERNINTGTTSGSTSTDEGFRLSKAGHDVKNCADIDCILSSSYFNQIIHKKGIDTSNSVSHNLGYIPNFLSYSKYSTDNYMTYIANDFSSIDENELYFPGGDSNYYIIFKEKMT